MNIVDAVVQGILLGGLYAIFAAGLSLLFGVMRLVNLAHGALAVLAAYGALLLVRVGMSPPVALLIVVPAMAAFGYLVQRFLLQRTLGESPLPALLATFGIAVVLENTLLLTMSADQQRLSLGAIDTAAIVIGPIRVGVFPLGVFLLSVLLLTGLSLLLGRTQYGRLVRAVSDDPDTVELVGADPRRLYASAAAIAFGMVAIAGVATGIQTSFNPTAGSLLLIFAFEAVIIGGLGSLWGTLAGALILGVAQTVGAVFAPSQQVLLGHLV
ncbi:MAG: branched-chain amino acid ABC transporter permease, partial [Leifsonia sp.]